ncbi:MAG TPA: ATPase, partial [Candidatus Kapabacteria bacterium]|nr:ATPase [Candidatus Kapabacteria bacterium]
LRRSGANTEQIQHVIQELKPLLYEGISTKKIFHYAFRLLKKKSRPSAAKYHLKKAIMDLGPSGYPFEIFVGEILRHRGFSVKIGQIVQGHCVEHEVDIVGQKDDVKIMVECK